MSDTTLSAVATAICRIFRYHPEAKPCSECLTVARTAIAAMEANPPEWVKLLIESHGHDMGGLCVCGSAWVDGMCLWVARFIPESTRKAVLG